MNLPTVFNAIFCIFMVATCLKAIQLVNKGKNPNFVEYAPSLLTSLGLFGTFLGIFWGLLNFDTHQIDNSIPDLLEGLKTAFITSIVGMGCSIFFKWKQNRILDAKVNSSSSAVTKEDITPKDIYEVMQAQHKTLQSLVVSMGGDSENSVVSQMKLFRMDVNDLRSNLIQRQIAFETKLWEQLNQFAEMLSKSATEQVIEALKNVIVDFNEKLTEQFGENFKRLDDSVKKLVDWQAQYKIQLEQMIQQYALGVQSIDETKAAVQTIEVETGKIPHNMEHLKSVLDVNQHQIQELDRHLNAFVQMRDKAIIAVPSIQQKLEEIGQQLHEGAQQVSQVLIQGSEDFQQSVQATNQNMMKAASEIADQSAQVSNELTSAMETLALNTERIRGEVTLVISEAMETLSTNNQQITKATSDSIHQALQTVQQGMDLANQKHLQHADKMLNGVEQQVLQAVSKTNEAVNEQLRQLDEALALQLTAALEELGSALASISNHMVKTVYDQQLRKEVIKKHVDYASN